MPKIQSHTVIDITPEKFLNACDSTELYEVELLLSSPRYRDRMNNAESLDDVLFEERKALLWEKIKELPPLPLKSSGMSKLDELVHLAYPYIESFEKELKAKNLENFVAFCHSETMSGGISRELRNEFGLWDPESPYYKFFKEEMKIEHPDDMSAEIVKAVWRKSHNL